MTNRVGLKRAARTMVATACLATLLAGCAANPETAAIVAQPKTPVSKTLTSFTQAKRCMDRLFRQYGKQDILITSDGIPDRTGTIAAGTKDMMISALSEMSASSSAFRFVDIDVNNGAVFWIQSQLGQGFDLPPYYIRGSISAVDRNVTSDSASVGISTPWVGLGVSADQITSIVTIDLQMGDLVQRQVIPGTSTTNTITVVERGRGGSAEGLINDGAISIDISQNRTEGTGQAVRTLLEYSLIELLGRFTKVPYSRCLEGESTRSTNLAELRDAYDALSEDVLVRKVQSALSSDGVYSGPIDGVKSRSFQDALNIAKSRRTLIPNGRVDFELFAALANEGLLNPPTAPAVANRPRVSPAGGVAPSTASGGRDPVGLTLTPPRGQLAVGNAVSFAVKVERDANLYCYYQHLEGGRWSVARIFPNRFQPSPKLRAGQRATIPDAAGKFKLRLADRGVREGVACIATVVDYRDSVPAAAVEPDLTSLTSASTIAEVITQHTSVDTDQTSVKVAWFSAQ